MGCDLLNFILASGSPRRRELLSRILKDYKVVKSNFDEETVRVTSNISDYVNNIALGKAKEVSDRSSKDSVIIAADTIVTIDEEILGKPKDSKEAFAMLRRLSGRWHRVYTSIVIINNNDKSIMTDVSYTDVLFSEITDEEIMEYIETKEPLDKAGAYGIQGIGAVFVEQIKGCYYNVVGLSLNRLNNMLKKLH